MWVSFSNRIFQRKDASLSGKGKCYMTVSVTVSPPTTLRLTSSRLRGGLFKRMPYIIYASSNSDRLSICYDVHSNLHDHTVGVLQWTTGVLLGVITADEYTAKNAIQPECSPTCVGLLHIRPFIFLVNIHYTRHPAFVTFPYPREIK